MTLRTLRIAIHATAYIIFVLTQEYYNIDVNVDEIRKALYQARNKRAAISSSPTERSTHRPSCSARRVANRCLH
jgi:hypothetical protein